MGMPEDGIFTMSAAQGTMTVSNMLACSPMDPAGSEKDLFPSSGGWKA